MYLWWLKIIGEVFCEPSYDHYSTYLQSFKAHFLQSKTMPKTSAKTIGKTLLTLCYTLVKIENLTMG